ncbi:MAG TPA: PAS domain-containing protein [Stellaceae bacterium]|nr:PAS domain-containing protein [Stellaceae bacterium]
MPFDYRSDQILGRALAYWEGKRGSRAMPSRAEIEPAEITPLLPNLQLIDVAEGGARFRYRLVGTAIVEAFGSEYTGKWLDELFTTERSKFAEDVYRLTCSERLPVFARSTYVTASERQLVANRVCMPLSADGATVTMIMGALTFVSSVRPVAGVWAQARMLDPRWTEVINPADGFACAQAAPAKKAGIR